MFRAATHPFISFEFNSRDLQPMTWLKLGEAMSKCEHLSGYPLKPAAAAAMSRVHLARGVHATTAIEGNTLTQEDAERLVSGKKSGVPPSRQYQEQELQNILEAIGLLDQALASGQRLPINVERLCQLNDLILRKTPQPPEVRPGTLRTHGVGVNRYRAPAWGDVPGLLESFVGWIDQVRWSGDDSRESRFFAAVLAAILAHLYIAWIHPFGNGNGRLARLIEVQILSESGVIPMVATNVLSNHYNLTREAYYQALDMAREDVLHFVVYSLDGFLDGLRAQVAFLRDQSLQVHWESYVHEIFSTQPNTDARSRQRGLALAMPQSPVTPEEATELNTKLAKLYAQAGERTPARDLNDLSKLGLVVKVGARKYRSNASIMEAFIPTVAWEPGADGQKSHPTPSDQQSLF